ncbi:hypothetical protein V8D89_003686 [Ganoderma adspersum]
MLSPFTFMSLCGERQSWRTEFLLSPSVCTWCRSIAPQGETLKRCQGCNIVTYCGRECQKAAWSRHRPLCRRGNLELGQDAELTGYATVIGIGEALNEWVAIHKYSLTVIVHSVLRRAGGVVANSRLGHVVVFNVKSRKDDNTDPAHENPATAFSIHITKLLGAEHAPVLASPEDLERLRPAGVFEDAGFRGDPASATHAGFVPVVFAVEETKIALATHCPVYCSSRHPDDTALDEETFAVFDDLSNVFVNFILNGIVLRPPVDERAADPETGKMVRGRKRWRWRGERFGWPLVDVMIAIDRIPLKTSFPAKSLWTRFQQW